MVVKRYRDLIAWQRAEDFKEEVVKLVEQSPGASRDFKYRDQLLEASRSVSTNIAEGFLRNNPGDFDRFLGFGLGSLGEAELRLRDGVRLGYFPAAACEAAFGFAKRCAVATARLRKSIEPFKKKENWRRKSTNNLRTPDGPDAT